MVRLTHTITALKPLKILVAGDLILDTYTIGKAHRISPEAPVAIVQVMKEESRPGGAGNAALNMLSLGAEVVLLGRIGSDATGERLRQGLESEGIDVKGLFVQKDFQTPLKNRIIAQQQQIVRVDYEQFLPISEALEEQMIQSLPDLLQDVSAVAISDYGKGMLSHTLLAVLIKLAKDKGIPVITDPKGIEFDKYSGSTIIKPNQSEAYAAAGIPSSVHLDLAAQRIFDAVDVEMLIVTRSESGISLFKRDEERLDFPVQIRELRDVTGAGDTVLAMLAYAMANGLSIQESISLSNIAAGLSVEHFGCARISLSDIARRLLELDVKNKIFDSEHLFTVQQALKGSEYNLLGLSSKQSTFSATFSTIQQLAAKKNQDLVIYIQDSHPDDDFLQVLASMQDVKFILARKSNLHSLCQYIQPKSVYTLSGRELVEHVSHLALLD